MDKKGVYDIAKSYGPSKIIKQMEVRHHYLQLQVNKKIIRITLVPTTKQWAEFLTIRVGKILLKRAMNKIGNSA